MSVDTRQAFLERASSGAYRGHGHTSCAPQRHVTQASVSGFMTDQNLPARGVLLQPRIYDPATDRRLCDPNPHSQHGIHRQCQYLTFLAERETKKELNGKELLEKEAFRKRLEKIVQKLVTDYAKDHVTVNPKSVRLKCYGSLASGFAVPGSDMDLLLMFPNDQGPVGPIEVESRRMIEKALLDLGHGARLLTKTRVPILRVCQNPSPELLTNLRKEREKWEEETRQEEKERLLLASGLDPNRLPPEITDEQSDAATVTFAELDTEPSIIPLPSSPARVHANLEYTADVGIQCDINFSNYVAIYNTTLLRCYCKCDPRVRPMGLFVKEWSKARKINTPYHGTLSSYGYVMMVLHYLMNIAQPPVIPNLQHLARDEDAWNNRTNVELFEGFDVRFVKDEALLERRAQAGQITKNRETLGSLLRGFFRYYTDSRGFHWLNEVISIRTQGGLLTKKSKDWTESKRAGKDNSIRLRYIFAVEDPFETDHNIARTVGRSGVAAIRDELHRTWNILSMIKYGEGRWVWYKENGEEGEDLFATANDRGDLLRQDQDYHRERMRKLNQIQRNRELEMKSGQNDKSASVESVDGRFPVSSRPSRSKDDANVSETRVIEVRSKLIDLGRVVQDAPAEKVKNLPKKLAQLGKENVNKGIDPDVTNVKGTWMDKSYDVSKWIESTAESNHSTKIDSGGTGEMRPEATVSGKASQRTTDIKQKISDVVRSPTNMPLRPSNNLALPKSPSIAASKQRAPASTASEMRPCVTLDPKNPLSAWNVTTQQGRWLTWRDEMIRAGKWHGISQMAKFGALDRQHPYDAARPLPDFEQQYRIANVRAKRNQYFDVKKVERLSIDAGGSHENQVTERKDSAISMGKNKTAPARNSKPGPKSGSGKRGLPYPSVPDRKTVEAPSTSAFTLALSSNNPEVIHNSDPEIEPIVEDSLAAVGDPDGHDYRHDFPVPIAPDFPFDPAQLRDLGIIAKGGSGCARDAKEQEYGAYDYDGFRNVELSNEWGGGGRMGEMATDSEELPVLDFASAEAKTFVPKGDEDGFLRELPLGW
jgi:terminal uridylyltransferase